MLMYKRTKKTEIKKCRNKRTRTERTNGQGIEKHG